MSYQDDKRELLKLKQGIIEESETIHEEPQPEYKVKGFKKVENFFYHYKWHLIVGIIIGAFAIFIINSFITKEAGDMRVIILTKNDEIAENIRYKTQDFELAFERYCPDYDDNGYIHVETYNIDLSENVDSEYMLAQTTKAVSEAMLGEARLYVVDSEGFNALSSDGKNLDGYINFEEKYPDCPYADGIFLKISESPFSADAGYVGACPDDLYIVVAGVPDDSTTKEVSEKALVKALEVVDNIVNGKYAGWIDDQGRIYGLEN